MMRSPTKNKIFTTVAAAGRYTRVLLILIVLALSRIPSSQPVYADQFDQQIQGLQQQNIQTQTTVSQLAEQATSYQDAVNRLQAQVDQVEQQIAQNENAQADLQKQIVDAQTELAKQRLVLGQIIKMMFIDGEPTVLEELATSKNLSDFVDKKAYRSVVQKKLQITVQLVAKLQATLAAQKAEVDQLLKNEHSQQAQIDANRAEQAKLLAYNQSQQADYGQEIQANQSKIADLRHQQAALISRYQVGGTLSGDPNHGGYPRVWDNAGQDSLLDSWGMFNRECVSYTAFKVHQDYLAGKDTHDMPYWGGSGDAKQWPANARAAGIPVDSNPTVNSIAISTAGTWGHSMHVESIGTMNGQSAIYVSQYNTDFAGHYSEGWRYTTGLVFIHF
ncbi:MAG: CHAP domain-containing protein [Candidatus Saccharibacteria bacterium]